MSVGRLAGVSLLVCETAFLILRSALVDIDLHAVRDHACRRGAEECGRFVGGRARWLAVLLTARPRDPRERTSLPTEFKSLPCTTR